MTAKLVALAFSLLILAQAWGIKRIAGTWLFPACLYGLFWFAVSFVPLVALFTVPIEPLAVGFLLLCALAFSSGALLFDWERALATNALKATPAAIFDSRFLRYAFWGSVAASLLLILVNTLSQGITWFDLVFNLFATAELYATLRYGDELTAPLVERWSVVFTYMGVLIGGLRFSGAARPSRRLIVIAAFVPSVLIAITQSAKWHFLLSIVLFYSGILAYRIWSGQMEILGRGNRRTLAIYGGVAILVITLSFLSRGVYAADSIDVGSMLTSSFANYSSGHLYAFADWFSYSLSRPSEWSYDREPGSYGFHTFATLFNLMGSDRVLPIGVYDDGFEHGSVLLTNVFTMFRGTIQDFGYAGTLVLMAVLSVIFHGAFYAFLMIRRPVFAVVAFLFMMAFIFSTFVVSMLGTNIIYYVTFALLWLTLWVNHRLTGTSPPHA